MKKIIVYLILSIMTITFQNNKLLAAAMTESTAESALSRPALTAEQIKAIRLGLTAEENQTWENAKKVSAAGASIDPRDISLIRDKVNEILEQYSLLGACKKAKTEVYTREQRDVATETLCYYLRTFRSTLSRKIDLKYIEELIRNGADVNARDQRGSTPLILAQEHKKTELVRLLLQNGAKESIDAQDRHGQTALMEALYMPNIEIVKLLLENGADIDKLDQYGCNALMLAVCNPEIIELLIQKIDLQDLYNKINTVNLFGKTALIYAAEFNQIETARILLDTRKIIDQYDRKSKTALTYAALNNNEQMVKLLLEKGLDYNCATFLETIKTKDKAYKAYYEFRLEYYITGVDAIRVLPPGLSTLMKSFLV